MADTDAYSAFLSDSVKMEADALGPDPAFDPTPLDVANSGAEVAVGGASQSDGLQGATGDGSTLF